MAAIPVTGAAATPNVQSRKGEEWHFQLEGLSCAACAAAVRRALQPLPGIIDIEVNPLTQKMRLELTPVSPLQAAQVIAAVEKAGYGAALTEQRRMGDSGVVTGTAVAVTSGRGGAGKASGTGFTTSRAQTAPRFGEDEYRAAKKRFWPSLVFTLPLMYLTMGPVIGLPLPGFFTGVEHSLQYALTQLLLTLPVIYFNRDLFRRGFMSLWRRNPNMDALIAVGSGSAFLYSIVVLYQMAAAVTKLDLALLAELRHSLYFESAATILTLIALGRMLEGRATAKTGSAIADLMELVPPEAEVERDGESVFLPLEGIRVGDTIVIRPGQKLPVDGTIVSGYSSFDTAAVTGESIPVEKVPGDQVLSGMINQSGSFRYRADKVGSNSTLAQMIRLVEEASSSRAPTGMEKIQHQRG
jgi:Cu+-exporting ATPase